jgi:protein SCO1/2
MSHLDEQTQDLANVHLLSFSVDPKYDTPAVLAEYATHYGAKPDRWRFVTGQYDTVQHLVEGALMSAMEDEGKPLPSGAPDIRHGGHILLVDRDLHIRGVYDSDDAERLDDLVADARTLSH